MLGIHQCKKFDNTMKIFSKYAGHFYDISDNDYKKTLKELKIPKYFKPEIYYKMDTKFFF